MPLILYVLDASPPVRAVYMTLELLGITDVEKRDVNIWKGEHLQDDYLKVNPQHTIPSLQDGDFLIWDSHAITTYLVNKYADNHTLYPRDPKKRAVIDQRLHFDGGILFTAARATVEPVVFFGDRAFKPENLDKIKKAYTFADAFLTHQWMAGDELTLADICCGATISSMNEVLPIDKNTYPNLAAWLTRLSDQDFFKKCNAPGLADLKQVIKEHLQE